MGAVAGSEQGREVVELLGLEGVSQVCFSPLVLRNELQRIPSGTNPFPKPARPFLEKLFSRVDRSEETSGAASSPWKEGAEVAMGQGMGGTFQHFHTRGKASPIRQDRSCSQRDSPARHEPPGIRRSGALVSHWKSDPPCCLTPPPPLTHTHTFQLCAQVSILICGPGLTRGLETEAA